MLQDTAQILEGPYFLILVRYAAAPTHLVTAITSMDARAFSLSRATYEHAISLRSPTRTPTRRPAEQRAHAAENPPVPTRIAAHYIQSVQPRQACPPLEEHACNRQIEKNAKPTVRLTVAGQLPHTQRTPDLRLQNLRHHKNSRQSLRKRTRRPVLHDLAESLAHGSHCYDADSPQHSAAKQIWLERLVARCGRLWRRPGPLLPRHR